MRNRRKSEGYNGTENTTSELSDLLPRLLAEIGHAHKERPDLVMLAWPEIIGKKLAPMTKALSFVDGILLVKVNNSTLYSLLSQQEKGRLLKSLREKFPSAGIKTIVFRLG